MDNSKPEDKITTDQSEKQSGTRQKEVGQESSSRPPYNLSSSDESSDQPQGQKTESKEKIFEHSIVDPLTNSDENKDSPSEEKSLLEFPFISRERYEFIEKIGQGGMGEVMKVIDLQTQRTVAMKRLIGTEGKKKPNYERFRREAEAVAKLNHPYIVPLFDLGRDETGPFLTMQYIEGESLGQLVEEKGKISPQNACEWMIKICQAIFYAHRLSIIHRDIKPENIMIDRSGLPRILDFGLARIGEESDISLSGMFVGTRFYASPEQFSNSKAVDHRTDIYSLGATFYYILSGETPRVVRPDRISSPYLDIVLKCMEEKIEHRYFSVDRLVEELEGSIYPHKRKETKEESKNNPSSEVLYPKKIFKGLCSCGHTNESEVQFCENCGTSLFRNCPSCSTKVSTNVKNCGHCGVNIFLREKSLELFRKARDFHKEFEFAQSCEQALLALEVEDLPMFREFLGKIERIQTKCEEFLTRGSEEYKKENYLESIKNYEYSLKLNPKHHKALELLEVSKMKLFENYLVKAREALEKEELKKSRYWSEKAKTIHSTAELENILEVVKEQIAFEKEKEIEEYLKHGFLGEDVKKAGSILDEEDNREVEQKAELEDLVHKMEIWRKKKKKETIRFVKVNHFVKKTVENAFFAVIWIAISVLIALVIVILIMTFAL